MTGVKYPKVKSIRMGNSMVYHNLVFTYHILNVFKLNRMKCIRNNKQETHRNSPCPKVLHFLELVFYKHQTIVFFNITIFYTELMGSRKNTGSIKFPFKAETVKLLNLFRVSHPLHVVALCHV